MSRDPRYRGLKPHPEKLGVTLLGKGEASRPVRVRASVDVLDWLGTLGAAEVGRLMTEAYKAAHEAAKTTVPKVLPPAPVVLVPGLFRPTQPHHIALIDDLDSGATLTQLGDTFTLERPDGSRRDVPSKTGLHLLDRGFLVVADGQARASTSHSPEERRRDTSKAPGRRKP